MGKGEEAKRDSYPSHTLSVPLRCKGEGGGVFVCFLDWDPFGDQSALMEV